jgi:hypothetical protein
MPRAHSSCIAAAKTTTVTTVGKAGLLYGYALKCGSTITSVLFKDGGTSGTVRWGDGNAAVTVAGDVWKVQMFPIPIVFSTDIYVTIAGTNAVVYVAYVEIED